MELLGWCPGPVARWLWMLLAAVLALVEVVALAALVAVLSAGLSGSWLAESSGSWKVLPE